MASKKKKKTVITIDLPIIAKDTVNKKRLLKLLGSKHYSKVTKFLEDSVSNYAESYHKGETISQICIINMGVISRKGQKDVYLTGYAVTERAKEIQLQTQHIQKKKTISNSILE
jgi:hypothetical protein